MNTDKAIILARKHIGNGAVMDSSARFCLNDALRTYERGDYHAAVMWAKKAPRRINVGRDEHGIYKILVPGYSWAEKHGVIFRQTSKGAASAIRMFPVVSL